MKAVLWDEKEQERIDAERVERENVILESIASPEGTCIGCRLWREKSRFDHPGMKRRENGASLYRTKKRNSAGNHVNGYCFHPRGICTGANDRE